MFSAQTYFSFLFDFRRDFERLDEMEVTVDTQLENLVLTLDSSELSASVQQQSAAAAALDGVCRRDGCNADLEDPDRYLPFPDKTV